MLTYFEITDEPPVERRGNVGDGPRKGQPYHIRTQSLYLHTGARFPEKFEIATDALQGELPYSPGYYLPAAGTFERVQARRGGDNVNAGKLGLGRSVKLVPAAEAVAKLNDLLGGARGLKVA